MVDAKTYISNKTHLIKRKNDTRLKVHSFEIFNKEEDRKLYRVG